MKLRHTRAIDAHGMFDRITYSSLDWPLKTVRLDPDSVEEYNQRLVTPRVSMSEHYHENSKLSAATIERLVAMRVDPDEVRRVFLSRRRTSASTFIAHRDLDPRVAALFTSIRDACPAELFYAIELRLCHREWLSWHEPISDSWFVVKALAPQERSQLASAGRMRPPSHTSVHEGAWIALVGNLARNELLFGVRGYRRTLLEAGWITEVIVREAVRHGITARASFEFLDRMVDGCLECDGIEESTLVIVELDGVYDR